jgi:hypothetical protein
MLTITLNVNDFTLKILPIIFNIGGFTLKINAIIFNVKIEKLKIVRGVIYQSSCISSVFVSTSIKSQFVQSVSGTQVSMSKFRAYLLNDFGPKYRVSV